MNAILLDLDRSGVYVVVYADDVAVSDRGKFPSTLTNLMQNIKWYKSIDKSMDDINLDGL